MIRFTGREPTQPGKAYAFVAKNYPEYNSNTVFQNDLFGQIHFLLLKAPL
jgi:hypothetical protein